MKNNLFLLFISILLFFTAECSNETHPEPESDLAEEISVNTLGHIEIEDEGLEQILNTQATPEIIGEGFSWSEGPVWVEVYNFLLFSDVPENRVYKWTEENGVEIYLETEEHTSELQSRGHIVWR